MSKISSPSRRLSRFALDLANGSKHVVLRRWRKDPETKVGRRCFSLELGGGPPRIAAKYEVEAAWSRDGASVPSNGSLGVTLENAAPLLAHLRERPGEVLHHVKGKRKNVLFGFPSPVRRLGRQYLAQASAG